MTLILSMMGKKGRGGFKTGKMEYKKTDGSGCTQTQTKTVGWMGEMSNQHKKDKEEHRGLFRKCIDIHKEHTQVPEHTQIDTHSHTTV